VRPLWPGQLIEGGTGGVINSVVLDCLVRGVMQGIESMPEGLCVFDTVFRDNVDYAIAQFSQNNLDVSAGFDAAYVGMVIAHPAAVDPPFIKMENGVFNSLWNHVDTDGAPNPNLPVHSAVRHNWLRRTSFHQCYINSGLGASTSLGVPVNVMRLGVTTSAGWALDTDYFNMQGCCWERQ